MKPKCRRCPFVEDNGRLCALLSTDEIEFLSDHSHPVEMTQKAVLDERVLSPWPIVAVLEGAMGIQHILEDGRRSISAFFTPGDILDLRRSDDRRQVSLRALTKARICKLGVAAFDQIQRSNPAARNLITYNLREQAHRSFDHAADLGKKQAIEKIASFIFECRNRSAVDTSSSVHVKLPMPKCDLAEYLGLQAETLSRSLKELDASDIIELPSSTCIVVNDLPRLRRLANGARA